MAVDPGYSNRFETFKDRTLFERLDAEEREFVRRIAFFHRLTYQELRQVVDAARDLSMWGQGTLRDWWQTGAAGVGAPRVDKKRLLRRLQAHLENLRRRPTRYASGAAVAPAQRERKQVRTESSAKSVFGMCPVASEKTVCCNLRTIDAVENCVFGCSYCSVQTFYGDDIVFDADLPAKLRAIRLDATRFYHIGTGQSSDALAWGNRGGILDALCDFAAAHPNVLLEFKTKSDNVRYFLERKAVPGNIVCSWSLNTPVVIANEEHFTADFDRRIDAARRVAARGIRVAFHFHPMVHYEGWESDYPRAASVLLKYFRPDEVAFVSLGSVTLIKPVIKKIRTLGNPTRLLQTELVPDPHGKLTYPDAVKVRLFQAMYEALAPWRDEVFMYLCMEKAEIWQKAFGYVYVSNEEFEREFGRRTMVESSL